MNVNSHAHHYLDSLLQFMTIEKPETHFEEQMDRFYTDPVWEERPSMVDNSPLGQRWEVVLLLQRLDTQLDEGI